MKSLRSLSALGVLLLTVLLASCGNGDLSGPVLPAAGNSSTVPGAGATADTTTTPQGISTLGSGN
jgi:hypothetical protein